MADKDRASVEWTELGIEVEGSISYKRLRWVARRLRPGLVVILVLIFGEKVGLAAAAVMGVFIEGYIPLP